MRSTPGRVKRNRHPPCPGALVPDRSSSPGLSAPPDARVSARDLKTAGPVVVLQAAKISWLVSPLTYTKSRLPQRSSRDGRGSSSRWTGGASYTPRFQEADQIVLSRGFNDEIEIQGRTWQPIGDESDTTDHGISDSFFFEEIRNDPEDVREIQGLLRYPTTGNPCFGASRPAPAPPPRAAPLPCSAGPWCRATGSGNRCCPSASRPCG